MKMINIEVMITNVIFIKFLTKSIFSFLLIIKIREIRERGPIINCNKNTSNHFLKVI